MKDIENEKIPKKIKKSIIKYLIAVFIILIISIIYRKNVTQIFIGTPRSMLPIGYNYFLLLYFSLIILSIILGIVVFYIVNKKDKRNVKNEENFKKFFTYYDISSFILFVTITITFFLAFVFSVTTVNGSSMNDTLDDGERVIVWHFNQSVRTNNVVVIHLPEYDSFLVKRIMATPNDILIFIPNQDLEFTIYGSLFINDQFELFITENQWKNITRNQDVIEYDEKQKMIVPSRNYFLLGDNRDNSLDSREFGLVNRNEIVGTVILRLTPLQRMGRPQTNII